MCDHHDNQLTVETTSVLTSESIDNEIVKAYSENGITISPCQATEEKLLGEGYRKLPDDTAVIVQQILQQLPSLVKDGTIQKDAQRAFSEATKGTFKCILDPSLQLGNSKSLEGAFSGLAFDKEGHLKTQANWIPNDAKMNISEVPQVTASIFNALSIVTAQYYLSRINGQLNTVNKKLDSIEQEIDIRKITKLQTLMQSLQDIEAHRQYTDEDTDRINATRIRIEKLIGDAELLVNQYKNELKGFHLQDDDAELTIKATIQKMRTAIYRYHMATIALAHAKVLAAYYNARVPEELKQYELEVNNAIEEFEENKNLALSRMTMYVSTSKAYKVKNYTRAFSLSVFLIPAKKNYSRQVNEAIIKQNEMLSIVEACKKDIKKDDIYELSASYKSIQSSKIEVILIGKNIYYHRIEG